MHIVRFTDRDYDDQIQAMAAASSLFDPAVEHRVMDILREVREKGDLALRELTERFDGAQLGVEQLRVSPAELVSASVAASESLRSAVAEALHNITAFSRRSLRKGWTGTNRQGGKVGEKYDPFQRIGIYVPGGTAPLVSTALMTVALARVAGCEEVAVCTPCNRSGDVNAALLFALCEAGATEIYRVGGAQAIAALALGTPTLRKVQKIFGPGNAYVVAAKRLLFGYVAVDLLPGPSEVLIIADDTAPPAFAAADMLAQAEHGSGHERIWLVTDSARVLGQVRRELDRQCKRLGRQDYIGRVLEKNTWLILVQDLAEGTRLANLIAPEHCELMTRKAKTLAAQIRTAGAIFLGHFTPTVLGDYVAGPSHELPTGGAGASFAGLTVDQFQRRTSLVEYSRTALRKAQPALRELASLEGLSAHARSAAIRLETL
jgi:histidinol dehydrogenase